MSAWNFWATLCLSLVVADALFALHPDWHEGELTRVRVAAW